MPTEGSRSARHCGKHFASVNKYLIWTTALGRFTMPACIEGEIEAQRSWPAEPGFEPYSVVPAPVLKSGVLGVHGCSFYSEEEFPGEKDVSIPLATLTARVQAALQPVARFAAACCGHPSLAHTEYGICSHFLIG